MRATKLFLRLWITATSVLSFFAGWIMLAHAPKPVQTKTEVTEQAALPTLAPLPPLDLANPVGSEAPALSPFVFEGQQRFSQVPFFGTGGS